MATYCPFRGSDCRADCTFFHRGGCLLRAAAEKAVRLGLTAEPHAKKAGGAGDA